MQPREEPLPYENWPALRQTRTMASCTITSIRSCPGAGDARPQQRGALEREGRSNTGLVSRSEVAQGFSAVALHDLPVEPLVPSPPIRRSRRINAVSGSHKRRGAGRKLMCYPLSSLMRGNGTNRSG